ncbi:hypothetical protein ZIOFF_046375 [Zingiber officinale]|uniref:Uncharacterized protein n=1 Tax=Zingiber officinale TaxID=94328 RepID=A0A8J5L240_ZINOF|nr:hypothetical protein ZIOFF_046375 [Zingiber officinale]
MGSSSPYKAAVGHNPSRNGPIWKESAKKPLSAQRRGGAVAVGLLALLLVGMILLATPMNSKGSAAGSLTQFDRKSKRNHVVVVASVRSQPTVEFVDKTEVIWQIPESPPAVVFIAHGCNYRAANFWDRSAHCPHCVGLPEDRLIVLNALGHRFAVIAVSSLGRCWSIEKDVGIAKGILQWWIENHELQKLLSQLWELHPVVILFLRWQRR